MKISSRKFTEELFDQLKIKLATQKSTILRALDKIERLGWQKVTKLLGKGRMDKSGDFTKGANLTEKQIKLVEEKIKETTPKNKDILEIIKIFKTIQLH